MQIGCKFGHDFGREIDQQAFGEHEYLAKASSDIVRKLSTREP